MSNFILKSFQFILPTFNILVWFYLFIVNIATCSAAVNHFCAIQADNTVACWGLNKDGQAMPPSGTFWQISAGGSHTCGIRTDKTVACWGLNEDGQSTPPSDTFLQISAGYWHNCGVRTDNTLACWGSNNPYWSKPNKEDPYLNEWKHVKTLGQAVPPSGNFLQVSAGGRHTCGVRTDHTVECWGSHLSDPPIVVGKLGRSQSVPPDGEFSQVSAGLSHTCGIRPDQQMECWGGFENGRATPPVDTFYSQIRAGFAQSCGLKTDHTVVCFGGQDLAKSEVARVPNSTCRCPISGRSVGCACTTSPIHIFSQLLEMGSQACGVRTDNTVACWGYDPAGHTFPPRGLIVKSTNPACLVYGVHNDSKHTQLFIANINAGPLEIYLRSEGLEDNYQIEALDIDRVNNQLYAASSEGKLYEVRNGAQALSEFGELGLKQVEALSFHPDRSLWGWSQGTGLFQLERDKSNELKLPGTVIVPYDGAMKIQDISWNIEGTILYGVENLEQGNRLWAYDPSKSEAKLLCEDLMASLKTNINALETHPDNSLIFTFEDKKKLAFGVIDVPQCQITLRGEIATDYHQVKGIAWPDCTKPAQVD
jgi:alpha-tubulin suppressor-like RCC1 family protein